MKRKGPSSGLLAGSLAVLLAGCGWFGADNAAPVVRARPGADRQIGPTGTLPPATEHRFEPGIAATDETAPQVGSVVTTKGGQKAQKEAAEKEIADRDAKEREAREAAEREAKAKGQGGAPPAQPAAVPASPPVASEPEPAPKS